MQKLTIKSITLRYGAINKKSDGRKWLCVYVCARTRCSNALMATGAERKEEGKKKKKKTPGQQTN